MKTIILLFVLIPTVAFAQQPETPQQRAARFEVYCVSQPPTVRAECREQARAAVQLYSANYTAAILEQNRRQLEQASQPRRR